MTMQRKTVAQRPLRTRSTVNPTVAKLQAQVNRLETKVATDEKVDMQLFLEENLEKMVAEKRITEKQSKLIVSHFEKDEDVTPLIEMAEEYEPLMQARKGADYQIATPQPVNPSYLTVIGDPDKSIKNLEAAKGKKNQLLAHYAATMGGQPAPDFDLEGYRLGLIGIQKAVMQATPRGGATS